MMLIFLYDPFYDRICLAHKAHIGSQKAHLSPCLERIGVKDVRLACNSNRRRHVAHVAEETDPACHCLHVAENGSNLI